MKMRVKPGLLSAIFYLIPLVINGQKLNSVLADSLIQKTISPVNTQKYVDHMTSFFQSDSLYFNAAISLSNFCIRNKKYDQAQSVLFHLKLNSDSRLPKTYQAKLAGTLGNLYFRIDNDSLCFANYKEAAALYLEAQDTNYFIKIQCNQTLLHIYQKNFEIALLLLDDLKPYLDQPSKIEGQTLSLVNNAYRSVYSHLGDMDNELLYAKKGIQSAKYGDRVWRSLMTNIANTYRKTNKDSCAVYLEKLFAYTDISLFPNHYIKGRMIELSLSLDFKQLNKATRQLNEIKEYAKENNFTLDEDAIINKEGRIALRQKKFMKASKLFKSSYENYLSRTKKIDLEYANGLLYKYFGALLLTQKDTSSVHLFNTFQKNQTALRKSIISSELEKYKVAYDTKNAEKKAAILDEQKATLESKNKLQKIILIGLGLLLIVSYFVYRSIRSKNNNLTDLNTQLQQQKGKVETLHQELSHRVKNNLAFISSLLEMQGRRIENEDMKQLLKDNELRIKALSAVHDLLYNVEMEKPLRLDKHLSDILSKLQEAYDSAQHNIDLQYNAMPIQVDPDTTMRIGLLVNELYINSVKHAFKDIDHPQISIQVNRSENEKIQISYQDNGPKYTLEESKNSMGHVLIHLLRKQLSNHVIFDIG